MGVPYGEVELRDEQLSGLELHAAARVMAEAGSGEIVVSAALAQRRWRGASPGRAGPSRAEGRPGNLTALETGETSRQEERS
jgi:class 3 adenylate cyclase